MFNLTEALAAIKDKPEFAHNYRDGFSVIDYHVAFAETFKGTTERETLILQNLRGTCFDGDGKIIRLAYHKFHNLNENPEYAEANFDFADAHAIHEKLDGSMIAPIPIGGSFRLGTRAGVTDVSIKAEDLMQLWKETQPDKFDAYTMFMKTCVAFGLTPIFEFCSREQRIVIDYPVPKLVLTGIRDIATGRYVDTDVGLAGWSLIDVVEEKSDIITIKELAAWVRGWIGEEGVVVRFDDGRFVKIKAEDYCLKHKALDGLRFEKDVLALILRNEIDDVLSLVDDKTRDRIEKYQKSVLGSIAEHDGLMKSAAAKYMSQATDRAEFAALAKTSAYSVGLFKLYEGKEYSLKDLVALKTGSSSAVDSVRWLIGPSYYSF